MLIKLFGVFALIVVCQSSSFSQVKPKQKKEKIITANAGSGNNALSVNTIDTFPKAPKTRGNDIVTLCFRNDTNRFIDIWDGNYYVGRVSPSGLSVSPMCFYINTKYFYRDWTAKTRESDYNWTFTRTTYNDDILVIHW